MDLSGAAAHSPREEHYLDPRSPETIYLSIEVSGALKSLDGGESWEHLTDRSHCIPYPDALIPHPDNELLMFTSGAITSPGSWRKTQTADSRIGRSRDGGRSWQVLERGLPEHIRGNIEAMSMNVWPGGFSLFAGTTDGRIFFSDDEGENWSTIAQGLLPVSKGGHYRNLPKAEVADPAAAG